MATPTDNGRVVPTDVVFRFTSVPDCTTCEPVTFDWDYEGSPDYELVLGVTNNGVDGVPDGTLLLTQAITTLRDGAIDKTTSFTWPQVTVPEGTYALEAWIVGVSYLSSTFTVTNGSSVSCLPNSSPTHTTQSPSGTDSSSTTNTSTILPIVGAAGDQKMSTGAIVGVVFAALGFLGAIVAAFVLYRYYRRRNAERRPQSPIRARSGFFEKAQGNTWRGGGSAGAKLVYGGQPPEGFGTRYNTAYGFGANGNGHHVKQYSNSNNNVSTRSSPGASEEDVASLSEEKIVTNAPSTAFDFVAATGLPVLPSRYRSSAASSIADSTASSRVRVQTRDSDPFATPRVQQLPVAMFDESHIPVSPAFPQSVSVSPASSTKRRLSGESGRSSNLTGTALGITANSATATSSTMHSHGQQPHSQDHHTSVYLTPPTTTIPAKRTMSARKPVPVYASNLGTEAVEMTHPTSPRNEFVSVTPPSTSPIIGGGVGSGSSRSSREWSSGAQHSHSRSHSQSASISISRSPTNSSLSETSPSPIALTPGLPELNHKSSFGDKPMHYLIPDPLPQQQPQQPPPRPPGRR